LNFIWKTNIESSPPIIKPTNWAKINPGTEPASIPVKESVKDRAKVKAGFAKDEEEVKSMAAPIQIGTQT
jgi:hypothetical protein